MLSNTATRGCPALSEPLKCYQTRIHCTSRCLYLSWSRDLRNGLLCHFLPLSNPPNSPCHCKQYCVPADQAGSLAAQSVLACLHQIISRHVRQLGASTAWCCSAKANVFFQHKRHRAWSSLHVDWDAHSSQHNARIEVHIGVQPSLDKVLITGSHMF